MAFLRTWYYFRLCLSFSCFGYDLTVIKRSHIINCHLFLQKSYLNKNKFTNLLLVTVVAQFTAKTTNSEKAIYFLSFMSYSINKPKPIKLFTSNDFIFPFPAPHPIPSTYSPVYSPLMSPPTLCLSHYMKHFLCLELLFNHHLAKPNRHPVAFIIFLAYFSGLLPHVFIIPPPFNTTSQ